MNLSDLTQRSRGFPPTRERPRGCPAILAGLLPAALPAQLLRSQRGPASPQHVYVPLSCWKTAQGLASLHWQMGPGQGHFCLWTSMTAGKTDHKTLFLDGAAVSRFKVWV